MSPRMAIRILMLSPIYFQLSLANRRVLVLEYCQLFSQSEPREAPTDKI
jgi:hypothetical protein